MLLAPEEIATEEVKSWQGLHLLHYSMSSCSQKVRILLREKGLDWTSHPINLVNGEQKTEWYLGINPNGVVPVLVHDGNVHIESNDILAYLDRTFPSSSGAYFPTGETEAIDATRWLELEDEMHVDLRNITFTFVVPGRLMKDAPEISEADINSAIARFQNAFAELDHQLAVSDYLCGDRIMLPDIAWFISVHRLVLGGYPIETHRYLTKWYQALLQRPSMSAEINEGPLVPRKAGQVYRWVRSIGGAAIRNRLHNRGRGS